MAQQTKNQIKSYFEAGDRPNDLEFGHFFDSIVFINEANQGSNTDITFLKGGLTLGGTLTLTGITDFKLGGNLLVGNLEEALTRPIQAYTSTNESIIFASGSISDVIFEGISGNATSSIKLSDNYSPTSVATFGTHTGKAFMAIGGGEVFHVSASSAGYRSFFSGSVGIGTASPGEKLEVVGNILVGGNIRLDDGAQRNIIGPLNESLGIFSNPNGANEGILFSTDNGTTTEMFLENGGNVGIGTSNPGEKLHVKEDSSNVYIKLETDKTDGVAQIKAVNDAHQYDFGIVSNDQFRITNRGPLSSPVTTVPFIIDLDTADNNLVLKGSNVGIGTNTPSQKLDILEGHIQLSTNYGIGADIGNASNEYIIYPYLTGMPTTFTNITPQGSVGTEGMSLQSDRTINFIETDSNILVGNMNLNEKVFDWDGDINANKIFSNEVHGDGSNLTGISSGQIALFGGNITNNNLVTLNSGLDGLDGEAKLTFDGTDLKVDGNVAIGKGTAGLFTPDAPLHIKHTGDSLGDSDLIHLSMQSTTTEGNISIKFSDAGDISGQHFKMTFAEGGNDLKFHSDSDNNILFLEHDGNVGIGTGSPGEKLEVVGNIIVGGNIKLSDGAQRNIIGPLNQNLGIFSNPNGANEGILFSTDNGTTTEMIILNGGNVGIGTGTPNFFLDVDRSDGGEDLGGTAGDEVKLLRLSYDSTSNNQLLFTGLRTSNGSSHTTSGTRIQLRIDSTFSSYIQFGGDGNNHGITFGGGSNVTSANTTNELIRIEEDGKVGIGTDNPNHKLEVHGTISPYRDIDDDWITFGGPSVTSSGGTVHNVTAGIRRLTGQGGIGLSCDSYLALHAGDHAGNLATTLAAFHNDGDGSPGDQEKEVIHLMADGDIEFRSQTQNGLDHADAHFYRMTNGHLCINTRSPVEDGEIKLTINGGISIDTNGNSDHGFIHQGTEGQGIGLFGSGGSLTNNRGDIHVGGDGRVTIGAVNPNAGNALRVKSRGVNTDVIALSSAGTSPTNIIQLTDTSDGHGLIDILSNGGSAAGAGSARISAAGSSHFMNKLGVGISSPGEKLHVKDSSLDVYIILETDKTDGVAMIKAVNDAHRYDFGIVSNDQFRITNRGPLSSPASTVPFIIDEDAADNNLVLKGSNVGIGTDSPGQRLTVNGTTAEGFDSGIGLQRDDVTLARMVVDTEGLKFQTSVAGDNYYFRNSANQSSMVISDNSFVSIGGDDSGVNQNFPMNFEEDDLGAYLEVQNERGGDAKVALISAMSSGQGDGIVYVGQNAGNGGGIMYAGDLTHPSELNILINSLTSPHDHISIFRTSGVGFVGGSGGQPDHGIPASSAGNNPIMSCPHDRTAVKFHGPIGIMTPVPGLEGARGRPALTIKSQVQGLISPGNAAVGGGIRLIDNDTSNYFGIQYTNSNLTISSRSSGGSAILRAKIPDGRTPNTTITFTGQHRSKPSVGSLSDYDDKIGQIVISDGTYSNIDEDLDKYTPTINEAIPKIKLSTKAKDKRVFGVVSDKEDTNEDFRTDRSAVFQEIIPIKDGDHRLFINSIGEGAILVSNYNGNLENGDYITTSPITGIGMKQDDDLLHNYTVAKITQDEDFTSEPINVILDGVNYSMKLVGCTYHCG